jgi:hypothetical protein
LIDGDYNRIDYDDEPDVVDSGELATSPEEQQEDESPDSSSDNQQGGLADPSHDTRTNNPRAIHRQMEEPVSNNSVDRQIHPLTSEQITQGRQDASPDRSSTE